MKKYTASFVNLDSQESNSIKLEAKSLLEAKKLAQIHKRHNYTRKFITNVRLCK